MYSTTILSGLAFAGFSVAQSTISLYIPGADPQSLIASIITSDATATTYALVCADEDSDDCGFPGGFTLTEGPSTAVYTLPEDIEAGSSTVVDFTGFVDCSLAASSAVCTESFGGAQANDPGISTETFSGTDFSYMPVILTDGPLPGVSAAPSNTNAAPTASNTGAVSSSLSTLTGSGASKTSGGASNTSSGSGSVQTKGASSTSTGGVPMITGNAKWVLGGAALVAALA